jgi:hypothetical protein
MMARNKIDPAVSRKAYADATKALKEKYSAEFADLLDDAYEALAVESPRQRSIRLQGEAQARRDAAAAKRAEREQAKVDEAIALLEAKGIRLDFDVKAEADFNNDTPFEVVAEGPKAS